MIVRRTCPTTTVVRREDGKVWRQRSAIPGTSMRSSPARRSTTGRTSTRPEMQKFVEIMTDERRLVPPEKIEMIAEAVVDSCDAGDGVVDGLINNPEMCRFEPFSLACTGTDTGMCLTPGQVVSLERAYAPTFTDSGEFVYTGHARGFELGWRMPGPDSEPRTSPTASFRYLGHENPEWSWRDFDLEADLALVMENAGFLEATETDLVEFRDRGGKLIMYHGWNDPGPSPLSTIQYYNGVLDTMGSGPGRLDALVPDAGCRSLPRRCGSGPGRLYGGNRAMGGIGSRSGSDYGFQGSERAGRHDTAVLCLSRGGAMDGCRFDQRCWELCLCGALTRSSMTTAPTMLRSRSFSGWRAAGGNESKLFTAT